MDLHPCDEKLFWYYIAERYRVRQRRLAGDPKPWTQDSILQSYKFVNVFRRHDRTTAWLLENFLDERHEVDFELLVHNICWFRMFNRWETAALLGWQTRWDRQNVIDVLSTATFPIFTGAYIIHSEHGESKLSSIATVCEHLYNSRYIIAQECCNGPGSRGKMENVWRLLQRHKHVGPFMAYQMVLDMMYTPLLSEAEDRFSWACVGPGALRGLRRLYPGLAPKDALDKMRFLTDISDHAMFDLGYGDVPPLDIHDIEFCLCELDKYCRVAFGEGRPRSSYPGGRE